MANRNLVASADGGLAYVEGSGTYEAAISGSNLTTGGTITSADSVIVLDTGATPHKRTIVQVAGLIDFADMADVTITGPVTNDVITWNGSAWVDETLAEAGIEAVGHTQAASTITAGTFGAGTYALTGQLTVDNLLINGNTISNATAITLDCGDSGLDVSTGNLVKLGDYQINQTGARIEVNSAAGTVDFLGAVVEIDGNDFQVDGTTFFVDASTNRVGVGTTSPAAQFTCYSGANAWAQYNHAQWKVRGDSGSNIALDVQGTGAAGIAKFYNGANIGMFINSSGQVGIGTATQTKALEVAGTEDAVVLIDAETATAALIDFVGTVGASSTTDTICTGIGVKTFTAVGWFKIQINGVDQFVEYGGLSA